MSPSTPPNSLPTGSDIDSSSAAPPPSQPLILTPDQLSALGLGDCQPGENYTIQLQAGDNSDAGQSFDVISAAPETGGENADEAPPGPSDGLPELPDEPPGEEGGGTPDDENAILGYSRKKKTPREGLPDTKKLREVL